MASGFGKTIFFASDERHLGFPLSLHLAAVAQATRPFPPAAKARLPTRQRGAGKESGVAPVAPTSRGAEPRQSSPTRAAALSAEGDGGRARKHQTAAAGAWLEKPLWKREWAALQPESSKQAGKGPVAAFALPALKLNSRALCLDMS